MATVSPSFEADLLARVIKPDDAELSPQAAKFILTMTFTETDRREMDILANKARQGTLSSEEQAAIDSYERIGNLLSLLKSKARLSLQRPSESP